MSRLVLASIAVITALLGLVFAIGFLVLLKLDIPHNLVLPVCGAFSLVIVLLQYALGPVLIDTVVQTRWTTPAELGPDFQLWLTRTCATFKIPMPRFGIIEEGSPNAFTYGNGPWNARVVVTRGIIDALDPEELKAVVAHELGHIRHRDFIVMTLVQALVLALYTLYMAARYGDRRNGWYVAILSFVAYQLSYYISLCLSRVREYMADFASAQIMATGNPLSSALVKIAYGMGRFQPTTPGPSGYPQPMPGRVPAPAAANASVYGNGAPPQLANSSMSGFGSDRVTPQLMAKLGHIQQASDQKFGVQPAQPVFDQKARAGVTAQALGAFGISGMASVRSAVTWQGGAGAIDPDHFTAGARWELFNPWARIAELISTHPLTARRIQALQKLNARWNVPNAYDFSKVPPGRYAGFFADILLVGMPWLFALGAALGGWVSAPHNVHAVGACALLALGGYSVGNFVQLLLKYRGQFSRSKVLLCLAELDVSHVRPKPVVLQGVFTGRLSAGMPWADDFVLQDESGYVACVLNQPLKFLEFLWGWMYSQRFVGREVLVHGWYRRFGAPFVEISHFEVVGTKDSVRSYYLPVALGFSLVCAGSFVALGCLLLR